MIYPFFETMTKFLRTVFISTASLCCLMVGAAAQEAMLFQIGFLPNMKYRETNKVITTSILTYSGSEDVMDDLVLDGFTQGMKTEAYNQSGVVFKTGGVNIEGEFPVLGEIVYYTNSATPLAKLDGLEFKGRFNEANVYTLDSAWFSTLEDSISEEFLREFQATFCSQFTNSFLLNIGDSAQVTRQHKLPFPGVDFWVNIDVTYKLMGFSSGVAYLTLQQKLSYDGPFEQHHLNFSLEGDGYMLYLPSFKYFSKVEMSIKSKGTLSMSDFTVTVENSALMRQNADWWELQEDN